MKPRLLLAWAAFAWITAGSAVPYIMASATAGQTAAGMVCIGLFALNGAGGWMLMQAAVSAAESAELKRIRADSLLRQQELQRMKDDLKRRSQ